MVRGPHKHMSHRETGEKLEVVYGVHAVKEALGVEAALRRHVAR